MTAEHTTWLAEEDDGTITAHCHQCNWYGTEHLSNRDQAGQEADLHTATKAGRTWPCPASDTHVEAEHEGQTLAVCPYCDLTVDVRPSYVSRREWRYERHDMILDDGETMDPEFLGFLRDRAEEVHARPTPPLMTRDEFLEQSDLADWWETTKAAVAGGTDAVRRLNEQARIRAMSEEYRGQKRSAS